MFWIEMFQAGSGKRVAGSQLRRIPYRHHAEGFSSLAWLYGGNLGVQSLQSSKPKREIPGKFRATGFVTHTSKGGHHDTSETVAQLHDLCAAFPGRQLLGAGGERHARSGYSGLHLEEPEFFHQVSRGMEAHRRPEVRRVFREKRQ